MFSAILSKLRYSWQLLLVILGENFPRWPPPSVQNPLPGATSALLLSAALLRSSGESFDSAQLSVFSSFDFLRHQTSNNRTSPRALKWPSTVGSTIRRRRRISTRVPPHTHTHTRSLANLCAGSTQFFPFLCCFCCLLLQGTTFFFASSATFFLFLATLTGYDRRPLLLHCLPLFHGRVLPSCWSTTTTSEHSRVWANFRCHKLCFFFYLHNWPTSSSAC